MPSGSRQTHSVVVSTDKAVRLPDGGNRFGWLQRLLRWAVAHPVAGLGLIIAFQTLPTLWAKDVWFPDEVRHAFVARNLIEHGHWLVLYLGDIFYADKPPAYFWLVAGIALVMRPTEPVVFMIAAALSGWFFLAAQTILGRKLGLGPRVVFLAGVVLLSNWFFIERLHQPRMDLLFAAFIMLSHAGFYASMLEGGRSRHWTSFAFLMAAFAVLTKGPFGAAFPLAAFVVYALRARNGRVLRSAAVLQGLLVFLSVLGLYLAGAVIAEGPAFLRAIMIDQI